MALRTVSLKEKKIDKWSTKLRNQKSNIKILVDF